MARGKSRFVVYPIQMGDALPEIEIPLLPNDAPIVIDLQDVFDQSYNAGPYRRRLRYFRDELDPPLSEEEWTWAQQFLGEHAKE